MAPVTATTIPSGRLPAAPPVASAPVSSAFLDRTKRFIDDNRAVLLGLGVLAAGGILYYNYSSSSSSSRGRGSAGGDASSAGSSGSSSSSKNKKKKNKKKSAFLKGEGLDGPLLEEIKPSDQKTAPAAAPAAGSAGAEKKADEPKEDESAHLEGKTDRHL